MLSFENNTLILHPIGIFSFDAAFRGCNLNIARCDSISPHHIEDIAT